ncbi:MAG TPA: ROK family protein, partial [Candidatus Eisenbacteria bacterium]|nr:ROK family protein [Candidatus Eisenbacteria bacterium]
MSHAPFAIGLDLGGTDLKAARIAPDGGAGPMLRRPSRAGESAAAPLEALAQAIAELSGPGLAAVGLGCPGVIDPATGTLVGRTAHLPHWRDVALRAWLAERTPVPAIVDNDANFAALAEATVGAAHGSRVSLTLTLGTGVGCGIVADGRIVHGAFGGAGEIGHWPIGSGEVPCPCGVPHCVEPEISAAGLLQAARRAGLAVERATDVFARAAHGEPAALALVRRMTDGLGRTIAIAADLLAPDRVVLAGGGAEA